MDLSSQVLKTLKAIGSADSAVDEKNLSKIVSWTLSELCGEKSKLDAQVDDLILKSIHSSLCVIYLEGCKLDADASDISDVLELQCGWDQQRAKIVACKQYTELQPHIRSQTRTIAYRNPTISSLTWKVDHVLGDREAEKPTKSIRRFNLDIPLSNGDSLDMTCTHEQMQILAEKLRDMLHEVHRVHK
eukprot:TRINITY_DN7511_c0_g1_i1.p1 TRINITY_DN7511_c0_g1~~TRINITY_DN7511_c0_g1_i1.p1  ORF type:complete len:188 (+),score=17.00 TRINITY_DN7511_c0_g1_i1:57-620(+)